MCFRHFLFSVIQGDWKVAPHKFKKIKKQLSILYYILYTICYILKIFVEIVIKNVACFPTLTSFNTIGWPESCRSLTLPVSRTRTTKHLIPRCLQRSMQVFMKSISYFCPIFIGTEMRSRTLIKFHIPNFVKIHSAVFELHLQTDGSNSISAPKGFETAQ